jgi:DNA-binding transcriptional LysR family regulator
MHAIILKYFSEVAACGSIRSAAERLHVSSSAVNRQIIQLEEELGTRLLDRLPNGVRLNAAGTRLLQHIQETQQGFKLLRADLAGAHGEMRGQVSVSAMDSLFLSVLLDAVRSFSTAHPHVTYKFNCAPAYAVMTEVGVGVSDIGVCFVNENMPSGVRVITAVDLPPGVVMAPDHPLAAREELTLDDCKEFPLVRHGSQVMTMQSVVEAAFVGSWDEMNTRLTCNFAPLLKELVLDGGCISFFSKISWIKELNAGRAVWRPLRKSGTEKMKLAVVQPASRALSAATHAFSALLVNMLEDAYAASHASHATPAGKTTRGEVAPKGSRSPRPAKNKRIEPAG